MSDPGGERLIGHWPLAGDCLDHSGNELHGRSHGVDLAGGAFDGRDDFIEVAHAPRLALGRGGFTATAWVRTGEEVLGVVGDVMGKYDAERRRGFTLCINSSAGGYNSHGDDRHLYFGIDDGHLGPWQDCGRPSPHSNYVSNSLTSFDGGLYAATTDAARFEDWCHVFRYQGGRDWADCGRVGEGKTHGVGPLIVHRGSLYAATWNYDWTRVATADVDCGRVYRYQGDGDWEDVGQPGENRRLVCLASYRGRLYVGGDDDTGGRFKVFVHEGGSDWRVAVEFPMEGPLSCFPHSMAVHDGKLWVSGIVPTKFMRPAVHCFDGERWQFAGNPVDSNQVHSLEVYRGGLYAGTWPLGKVGRYLGGEQWQDCGRMGDSTEVNALTVYNGKLYAGSIPRSEVYRYEGGDGWTRLARFHAPEGWEPVPVEDPGIPDHRRRTNEWGRVTSLTIHDGRLFGSIASCTASVLDAPLDVRGTVWAVEAGKCLSYDRDLGSGWRHLAAVREPGRLALYVDGVEVAAKPIEEGAGFDLANDEPLRLGFGELGYFRGHMRDVRLYGAPLSPRQVEALCAESRHRVEA